VIVNYDETATSRDAVTSALLDLGAGVVQFRNFECSPPSPPRRK